MNLNVTRAIKLPFSGQRWAVKVLIGAAIWLVAGLLTHGNGALTQILHTIIGAFTIGYSLRVMQGESRATANTLPSGLPEWNNWLGLLGNGLIVSIASAVYGLIFFGYVLLVGLVTGAGISIAHGAALHSAAPAAGIGFLVAVGVMGVFFAVMMPLMIAHFAHQGNWRALFQFGTVVRKLVKHPGNVVVAALTSVLVFAAALVVSLTIIGAPFAAFLAQVTLANVWAQVYRAAN